jgi:hypothetical protein
MAGKGTTVCGGLHSGCPVPPLVIWVSLPPNNDSFVTTVYGTHSVYVIQANIYSVPNFSDKLKLNSVVLVRKRTIPTERLQPVGEVSAKFS